MHRFIQISLVLLAILWTCPSCQEENLNDEEDCGAQLEIIVIDDTRPDSSAFNGSFTVEVHGGTAPYSYSLDNENYQPSATFDSLEAGNYIATVKDDNGCINQKAFTLLEKGDTTGPGNTSPTIAISSPENGDTLTNDLFVVTYKVTNWDIQPQGKHLQYFINGVYQDEVYSSNSFSVEGLDSGDYIIKVQLAEADGATIDVSDSVSFVFRPSGDTTTTFTLTVNAGSGSGTHTSGSNVSIAADNPPDGQVFSEWTGDVGTVDDVSSSSTFLIMPNKNIAITATYEDEVAQVSYANQIAPILMENCAISGCHNGDNGTNRDWTVFANVQANASEIKRRTANRSMPKASSGKTLTEEEINLIGTWVDQGAKDN